MVDPQLEGKRRENIAWCSKLCAVMYGEQHLFISVLFVCFLSCTMLVKNFESDIGGIYLTQDHEEQEDRSKIMNNRTKQLIQLISKVHSMYNT